MRLTKPSLPLHDPGAHRDPELRRLPRPEASALDPGRETDLRSSQLTHGGPRASGYSRSYWLEFWSSGIRAVPMCRDELVPFGGHELSAA